MHPSKFMQKSQPVQTMGSEERLQRLDALGTALAGLRKEAVDARKSSGIEDIWLACEEAYIGIDDANRAEFSGAKWAKPTSMSGPLTSNQPKSDDTKSTVFVPLTSRYVDGASSKLSEIILPIDDKAFSLQATPNPDMVKQANEIAGMVSLDGQPQGLPSQLSPAAEAAKQMIRQASEAAEKAETRIYDWMTESKYPFEARKVIKDAARIGVGILKGPVPAVTTRKAMVAEGGDAVMQVLKETKPVVSWVDPWNFFPADGCGENIHDGDGCFERDYLSPRKLKSLRDQPGYLPDQIDKVLEEGPGKTHIEGKNPSDKESKRRFDVWYYYGSIKRTDLELTGTITQDEEAEKEEFGAILTLVNDTVIRAIINPLDSGDYPYHVLPWRRRPGHWAGVGVAEQMFIPQRMVNAATRALLNNAGLSSGPQIIIDQLGITPADNNNKLYPGKLWYKTAESPSADVRDAFQIVTIPSVEPEMMAIIQYGMKMAEEATSIPMITQGRDSETSPQTFGQAELQNSNATTWLRDIGYSYDGYITEPLVDAFYEWLLLDPSVPNEEKGDFSIVANGSSAMVERSIQEMTMVSLLNAAGNPSFNIDPDKLMGEYLKSKRLDPRKIQLSDEDKAKRAQQQTPPPPQVQAAQIRSQTELQKTQMVLGQKSQESQQDMQLERELAQLDASVTMQAAKLDTDRDTVYVQSQERKDQTAFAGKMEELRIKREIALLEYSSKNQMTLDQTKAALAQTSMQENTKKELAQAQIALNQIDSAQERAHDLHKHQLSIAAKPPEPLEPAGRAPAGESFAK